MSSRQTTTRLTTEFSGFLLYKELGRRLKKTNPVVAEIFSLMSRDEARHVRFLNKGISDLNLALDLVDNIVKVGVVPLNFKIWHAFQPYCSNGALSKLWLLLLVDDAHIASCEMTATVFSIEATAQRVLYCALTL
ncbi:hypothetical protein J5N97_009572 [Dioscorea zingiberensis]|uniref:magnesium-protoporphyrin IX monomethyl ester (oxidative) cyclase n=1 Tax=Dioscorea zingiberensis TaxID=325984 RepID=A0A9D5HMT7_9LILI|nr:hypothetical protein J5N97_009572 [Dioscorea zingiberensis]